jgi:hypothetical protein
MLTPRLKILVACVSKETNQRKAGESQSDGIYYSEQGEEGGERRRVCSKSGCRLTNAIAGGARNDLARIRRR